MYRKIRRNRLKEIKTVSSKSGPPLSNTPQPVRHAGTYFKKGRKICAMSAFPTKTAGVF